MARTLAQLLTDTRQHIGQTDADNSQFSNIQLTIWLNEAYREVVSVLRHLPITPRSYTITDETVTLNANTVTTDYVRLKNPDRNGEYDLLEIIKLDDLMEIDPDYENADEDMPTHYVQMGFSSGMLYPPPKASVVAQANAVKTQGLELPAELANDSDTPDLPGNVHEILAHWPAYRVFSALENQTKATEHITLFRSRLKDRKGLATEGSKKNKKWRWVGS